MIFDIVLRRRKSYGGLRAEAERPRSKPRNTAMVGAHLWGASHRAETRGAAETHPTPAARTQQRIEALTKTANFHDEAWYGGASVW